MLQGVGTNEMLYEETNSNANANNNSVSPRTAKKQLDLDESQQEREANIKQLVQDCRKQLIDDSEDCYGSWALIKCDE